MFVDKEYRSRIVVLYKEPGDPEFYYEAPLNTLEGFQDLADGYIETITIHKEMLPKELEATGDLVIIINEEGRLKGMDYCCTLFGFDLYGPVVLAGVKGDEFADFPISWMKFDKYYHEGKLNRGGNLL